MALISIKNILAEADLATPVEFSDLTKEWRVATESGSEEPLLAFFAREKGLTEDVFLERLAKAMDLRFVDLKDINPSADARKRVTTKVAFQHFVLPIHADNGTLEVAVSDPFDSVMINAVQFNAGGTVKLALAPRGEIEKALKKYYGVGAETLEELEDEDEEPFEIFFDEDKEITEGDQDASVIKFVNQVI